MEKKALINIRKKAAIDLLIIAIATFFILSVYIGFQEKFTAFAKNIDINILIRTVIMALMQFGVAGLGITIVAFLRKESFFSYGLNIKGLIPSIIGSVIVFIPYTIFCLITGKITGYLPFQSVWMTKEVLASVFPVNIIGMLLISTAWGFFEGFNYIVISKKINTRFPPESKWLNWGAISCGILCILIHGFIGITPEGIFEAISVFIIIYGMLMVKQFTGNAWGSIFIFIFLWNAF
jgi:hypothetical protein